MTEAVVATIGIVAAVMAAIREWGARGGRTAGIRRQVELYQALPDGSSAKQRLLQHIDDAVVSLITRETVLRRDVGGIALALVALGGAIYAGVVARDDPWYLWILSGVLLLFGLIGLKQSVPLALRDERGRRIDTAPRRDGLP